MITRENISIRSSFDINALIDMQMEIKEGEHGKLVLRGYLSDGVKQNPKIGDAITVVNRAQEGKLQEVLFCGIIQQVSVYMENGIRQINLLAATHSVKLDQEGKNRSFQDIKMTYIQVINQILSKYHGKALCANATIKTGLPMLQYRETDWQFLRRLSGYVGLAVFCDEKAGMPCFRLGFCDNGKKVIFSENSYRCQISEEYYRVWNEAGAPREEFMHYQVESTENYEIGDYAYYKGQTRYIYEKRADWKNGALLFYYRLGGKCHFARRKEYNKKITGLALAGSIIRTEEEKVYIRLDIDGEEGKAMYPYPWSPATGNLLYCVAQAGTRAYLCFPDCREERAFVGNSMRMGSQHVIPETPQCRLIETEHGKQLQLYEDNIALKGGQEPAPQIISMEPTGCILTAGDGKVVITAAEKVTLEAPIILLRTPLEFNQIKSHRIAYERRSQLRKKGSRNPATGGDASVVAQYEFSGFAKDGVLYGHEYEIYFPFDDAPEYSLAFPKIFTILAGAAVALLVGAVVGAAVFLAAPAAIAVAGATITALQIGAFAGAVTAGAGIIAAVVTAKDDDGTTTMGEYLHNSFKASAEIGAGFVALALSPYAAEMMTAMAVPSGMTMVPIFGHWISAATIESIIGCGVGGITSAYAAFQATDVNMFFFGQKELGAETGNQLYDDLNMATDMAVSQIMCFAAMNPRLYGNAKNNLTPKKPTSVSSAASYQNPASEGGTSTGVGNPVKIEGRGSTGRTLPNTLNEQMAMHQVQSNPLEGATKVPIEMTDPRWPASEGWVKMQSVVEHSDGTKTVIHYVYNEITGAFDDFKFK